MGFSSNVVPVPLPHNLIHSKYAGLPRPQDIHLPIRHEDDLKYTESHTNAVHTIRRWLEGRWGHLYGAINDKSQIHVSMCLCLPQDNIKPLGYVEIPEDCTFKRDLNNAPSLFHLAPHVILDCELYGRTPWVFIKSLILHEEKEKELGDWRLKQLSLTLHCPPRFPLTDAKSAIYWFSTFCYLVSDPRHRFPGLKITIRFELPTMPPEPKEKLRTAYKGWIQKIHKEAEFRDLDGKPRDHTPGRINQFELVFPQDESVDGH